MNDPTRAALAAELSATHDLEREIEGGGMSRVFVVRERALGPRDRRLTMNGG